MGKGNRRAIANNSWETIASGDFDQANLFSAYLHTLRWNCVTSTNTKLFQSLYRAGIEVKAYLDLCERSRYAIDSHRTRKVREVAKHFEHKLFLSAIPHNGHSNSFAALLEILDPQRFCRGR